MGRQKKNKNKETTIQISLNSSNKLFTISIKDLTAELIHLIFTRTKLDMFLTESDLSSCFKFNTLDDVLKCLLLNSCQIDYSLDDIFVFDMCYIPKIEDVFDCTFDTFYDEICQIFSKYTLFTFPFYEKKFKSVLITFIDEILLSTSEAYKQALGIYYSNLHVTDEQFLELLPEEFKQLARDEIDSYKSIYFENEAPLSHVLYMMGIKNSSVNTELRKHIRLS